MGGQWGNDNDGRTMGDNNNRRTMGEQQQWEDNGGTMTMGGQQQSSVPWELEGGLKGVRLVGVLDLVELVVAVVHVAPVLEPVELWGSFLLLGFGDLICYFEAIVTLVEVPSVHLHLSRIFLVYLSLGHIWNL